LAGKKFRGYLDRLRENLEVLDESIASARKPAKGEKAGDKRARLKLVRDLVELRSATLGNIKVHLLGRDETGAPNEPDDIWESHAEVEFERYFRNQFSPWTESSLKLTCEDCGVQSEEVSDHYVEKERRHLDLCEECYAKRTQSPDAETDEARTAGRR
jgi:hypothetical protein